MKTSELQGIALNWAVAKANGHGIGVLDDPWFNPSTDWRQGGPIIERERIGLGHEICEGRPYWVATGYLVEECGPTPLIAAMRCYVASKLGDEIEVPKELTGE
jgi:hypothetical protein